MPGRLHVDIVDYPGEWLLDLPLLDLDFRRVVEPSASPTRGSRSARRPPRPGSNFISTLDPDSPADEQVALSGAGLFTRYLQDARAPDPALAAPGPGPLPAARRRSRARRC